MLDVLNEWYICPECGEEVLVCDFNDECSCGLKECDMIYAEQVQCSECNEFDFIREDMYIDRCGNCGE